MDSVAVTFVSWLSSGDLDGLRDAHETGLVEHHVDAAHRVGDGVGVADVAIDDCRAVRNVLAAPRGEVVEHADLVVVDERVGDVAADEAGATRYEDGLVVERTVVDFASRWR